MIQAAIFDMDGLLIDTEPEWQRMERDFVKKMGIDAKPEHQKQTLGLRSIELIKYWYHIKPWPDPDFEKTEKEFNEGMRKYYLSSATLMNGAMQVLDLFKKSGLKMALASSSPMFLIDTFIDKFTLHEHFDIIHSAEFEEFGKPHPAVYINAAKKLHVPATTCLAFEDSFNGLLAAKSAMMMAIAVPDPKHFDDPRFAIADLKLKSLTEFGEKQFNFFNGK